MATLCIEIMKINYAILRKKLNINEILIIKVCHASKLNLINKRTYDKPK